LLKDYVHATPQGVLAVAAGLDMATWARPILQAAAQQEIAKAEGGKRRSNP